MRRSAIPIVRTLWRTGTWTTFISSRRWDRHWVGPSMPIGRWRWLCSGFSFIILSILWLMTMMGMRTCWMCYCMAFSCPFFLGQLLSPLSLFTSPSLLWCFIFVFSFAGLLSFRSPLLDEEVSHRIIKINGRMRGGHGSVGFISISFVV